MTVYVDHDYLKNLSRCTTVQAILGNLSSSAPNVGIVTVLIDGYSENVRKHMTPLEFDEFGRLKMEMEKLFLVAEARMKSSTPVNPPLANHNQAPPPPAGPGAWIPNGTKKGVTFVHQPGAMNRPPAYAGPTQSPPALAGHTCCRCKAHNEYAEANMPDGSYLCFGCRP